MIAGRTDDAPRSQTGRCRSIRRHFRAGRVRKSVMGALDLGGVGRGFSAGEQQIPRASSPLAQRRTARNDKECEAGKWVRKVSDIGSRNSQPSNGAKAGAAAREWSWRETADSSASSPLRGYGRLGMTRGFGRGSGCEKSPDVGSRNSQPSNSAKAGAAAGVELAGNSRFLARPRGRLGMTRDLGEWWKEYSGIPG